MNSNGRGATMRGWHCVQLRGGKNGWTKKLLQPSSEREKQHRPRGGSERMYKMQ